MAATSLLYSGDGTLFFLHAKPCLPLVIVVTQALEPLFFFSPGCEIENNESKVPGIKIKATQPITYVNIKLTVPNTATYCIFLGLM